MDGEQKTLCSMGGLARRAGVHRAVVVRLVAQAILVPDWFLEFGEQRQPLFLPERDRDVFRHVQPAKSRTPQSRRISQ
jgi:hypothetical protein